MSTRRISPSIALAIAAATLAPRFALAQTDTQPQAADTTPASPAVVEARQHYAQGAVLFEHENFDAAVAEFQRAYELLSGNPRQYAVLYNLAQCNERLFRYDAALDLYHRYLTGGGAGAEDRATVEATMRALEQLLATLRITTNVTQAEVWIDDRRVGTAPGDVRVPGGRHVVQLRAADYLPAQQEVTVAGRATRALTIDLQRIPQSRGIGPVFSLGAFGIGVVAAGVGAGFGIAALGMSSRAMDDAHSSDPTVAFAVTDETKSAIRQTALTADVLYGIAGAFGITGVVLLFMTDWRGHGAHRESPPTHVALLPTFSPGRAGLSLTGAF